MWTTVISREVESQKLGLLSMGEVQDTLKKLEIDKYM